MKILFPTLLLIKTLPAIDLHHEATTKIIIVHITKSSRRSDSIADEHLASCTFICTWAKFNEMSGTCLE